MTQFLARLGDRINPIVVKETRQAVNSRLVAGFMLLFLAIQLTVMLLMMGSRELSNPDDIDLRAGRDVFAWVQGILLGTCLLLVPTMTGVRLAAERSDVNVDLLFISSLTPRAVLSGKLFAAAALALLIFSASAPFMTFAYVMRGLDIPTLLLVLAADFVAVMVGTTCAVFLASVPATRGLRIILGLLGLIGLVYLGIGWLGASYAFLRFGFGFDMATWDFWLGCAGVFLLIAGGLGLIFVWSVALVSPPAANRALTVRIYTLGLWILEGIGFALWCWKVGEPEPMVAWGVQWTIIFSLQMLIATCEREKWGARVARRIPRRPWLRPFAFLLYSGAAGGFALGAIGCLLTIVALLVWHRVMPSTRLMISLHNEDVKFTALLAGYAYCYCLTAVIVRRLAANTPFRAGYTWLAAGVLFGCGCVIPYIIRFLLFDQSYRYGYHDETIWLYLPNPAVMIDDAMQNNASSHESMTIAFLLFWGALVTVVNFPWLLRQAVKFRPPEDDPGARPSRPLDKSGRDARVPGEDSASTETDS